MKKTKADEFKHYEDNNYESQLHLEVSRLR